MTTNLKPGDIFLTQGTSFISRAIRFFSRTGGESRTEANHVGIVVAGGTEHSAVIVEALTKVKRRKMSAYASSDNTKVAVYRPTNVSDDDMALIMAKANSYVGNDYGYVKIAAHLADWFLGGRYFFRRFAAMDKYPICSWVVAYAYAEAGYDFGVHPGAASPDDIHDFCVANPDKYIEVHPMELI
jgi:hypothetical protein